MDKTSKSPAKTHGEIMTRRWLSRGIAVLVVKGPGQYEMNARIG